MLFWYFSLHLERILSELDCGVGIWRNHGMRVLICTACLIYQWTIHADNWCIRLGSIVVCAPVYILVMITFIPFVISDFILQGVKWEGLARGKFPHQQVRHHLLSLKLITEYIYS